MGIPGMAEEIEGAMQQAPHPGRQAGGEVIFRFYSIRRAAAGNWKNRSGTHPAIVFYR
jgi:hypothetical protein